MTETTPKTPFIQLSGVTFAYPGREPVLRELDFDFHKDRRIGLIGPNAGGKTTLLLIIMGLLRPQAGTVLLEGRPLMGEKDFFELRQRVGFLFQHPEDQLFSPTVLEDVAFGPLNLGYPVEEVQRRVEAALRNVGLEGYGERSSFHISFGERKLASIATVLACDPQLIALDEPTSNLDLAHRRKIIRWLQGSTRTIVLTSHDLDMILETCQRVLILNRGKIVADGPAREILSNQPLLESNQLELPLSLQGAVLPR